MMCDGSELIFRLPLEMDRARPLTKTLFDHGGLRVCYGDLCPRGDLPVETDTLSTLARPTPFSLLVRSITCPSDWILYLLLSLSPSCCGCCAAHTAAVLLVRHELRIGVSQGAPGDCI